MSQEPQGRSIEFTAALALAVAITLCPSAASARTLEFVEQQLDARLTGARALAVSEDGRHVYVSGHSTLVFEREGSTGELGYVDALPDDGRIALSPDGRNLYQYGLGWVGVFARDRNTGTATLVEAWEDRMPGIYRLSPISATVSPDGRNVYVATQDSSLVVFTREPRSGVLTYLETHHDGVASVAGLGGARHISVSPDGTQVYVASNPLFDERDGVAVFGRDENTGELSFVHAIFNAPGGIESLRDASFVLASPDGRNVYIAGSRGITTLARNGDDGRLSFAGLNSGYSGSLAVSADGLHLYSVNLTDAAVKVFARNAEMGTLTLIETFSDGIGELRGADAVAVTPDGRHVYLVSSDGRGWVATLTRDTGSGKLSFIAATNGAVAGGTGGVRRARSLATSPDGHHLYVANRHGWVSAFSRSAETGGLQSIASYGQPDGIDGIDQAESVTVSPDGRNVYVASVTPSNALVVLARDTITGELDFIETHFDGVGGVDGLFSANSVTVSPDGQNVYVTGFFDRAVAVFGRDEASGKLDFLEVHLDGANGVDGLYGARAVIVSPDGDHVYTVSIIDGAIAVFDREHGTGKLNFVEAHFSSRDGVGGLSGTPYEATVSPDGKNLYVATSRSAVAFARDLTSGKLSLIGAHPVGLHGAQSLVVSPGGEVVYTFGEEVTVFSRDATTGALQLVEAEGLLRYASYWGSIGVQSPDGNHLYIAASVENDDAIVVLRRNDGPCQLTPQTLCLGDNRFRIELDWRDHSGRTGSARGVPYGTDDSGLFWFFSADNWEMLIKVLDGCALNDRFWTFAAATTDVEYNLRVTDVLTGLTKSYFNPLGQAAPTIADTDAFATCDASRSAQATGEATAGTQPRPLVEPPPPLAEPDVHLKADRWAMGDDLLDGQNLLPGPMVEEDPESRFQLVGTGDKCLNVEGGIATDGTPVNLFECHLESNQRWHLQYDCGYGECHDFIEIRGLDGKCLEPAATESASTPLVIGPCGGPEDRWIDHGPFPERFSLEHVASGQCLDVEGGGTENGTPVNLYDCHQGANQLWDYREIRCVESPIQRCLNQNRFLVEVEWRDFEGNTGLGRAVRQGSSDSGIFWFFTPDNWEMLIKVLDGCDINAHHWVFASATTNVEYTLRITDTQTGQLREYFNPLGRAAPAITDTSAFSTCP